MCRRRRFPTFRFRLVKARLPRQRRTASGLTCDGQYDFGCRFLYDRAVPLDGLELQLTDMNIGTTSFQQVGQGGICLWLAADETLANAIRIPIQSNVYGNSGGGVFDTAGNTYYDAGEGPFFWSSSGGQPAIR